MVIDRLCLQNWGYDGTYTTPRVREHINLITGQNVFFSWCWMIVNPCPAPRAKFWRCHWFRMILVTNASPSHAITTHIIYYNILRTDILTYKTTNYKYIVIKSNIFIFILHATCIINILSYVTIHLSFIQYSGRASTRMHEATRLDSQKDQSN